ncbi:unnamed protein product [Jaminaea pallidilutea]
MAYRSHKRTVSKERQVAGWKAALNNPSTTSDGRRHARLMLFKKGHIKAALLTHASLDTRIRRMLGLRAKHHAS